MFDSLISPLYQYLRLDGSTNKQSLQGEEVVHGSQLLWSGVRGGLDAGKMKEAASSIRWLIKVCKNTDKEKGDGKMCSWFSFTGLGLEKKHVWGERRWHARQRRFPTLSLECGHEITP